MKFADWFADWSKKLDRMMADMDKTVERAMKDPLPDGTEREVTESVTRHANGGITRTVVTKTRTVKVLK